MDRARALLRRSPSYEPLYNGRSDDGHLSSPRQGGKHERFSYIEYTVFVWLGIAMLWAWNMFIAAGPYLQHRFHGHEAILRSFQPAELAVATLTSLGSMLLLSRIQANASYPRRIMIALIMNSVTFTLLAISTKAFLQLSASAYFVFIVIMVFATSLGTGFMQNGAFAYASGFGQPKYMQGIMFGQGIAGVLPAIIQIIGALSASSNGSKTATSALAFFLAATGLALFTLLAFWLLDTRQSSQQEPPTSGLSGVGDDEEDDTLNTSFSTLKSSVSQMYLFKRLFYSATALFFSFAVTMVFPVFTQQIYSTNPSGSPLLKDAAFVPLALVIWNTGDLLGRAAPAIPGLSLASRPRVLLLLAVARFLFVPLYLLCNIRRGGVVDKHNAMPDAFYLLVVQFPFGFSNGFVGTCCMSGASKYVEEHEREAAGAFMGVMLVGGLAFGSLCSFFIGAG